MERLAEAEANNTWTEALDILEWREKKRSRESINRERIRKLSSYERKEEFRKKNQELDEQHEKIMEEERKRYEARKLILKKQYEGFGDISN